MDCARGKTRVDFAKAFIHWRILKEDAGYKTDYLFSKLLLNW